MTDIFPLQIDVPLRERRTYLHSTNLFEFLLKRTGAVRNLNLVFRGKIECEAEALPTAECCKTEDYPARFTGDTANGKIDLVIFEKRPLIPLTRREPYDEDAVASGSRIEGTAIYSDNGNDARTIDRIVALNKKLLTHVSEGQRILLFSKIFVRSMPPRNARLKIVLKSRLGLALFRSTISADEEEIGEIAFYGT